MKSGNAVFVRLNFYRYFLGKGIEISRWEMREIKTFLYWFLRANILVLCPDEVFVIWYMFWGKIRENDAGALKTRGSGARKTVMCGFGGQRVQILRQSWREMAFI